jgi:hypothetical protein
VKKLSRLKRIIKNNFVIAAAELLWATAGLARPLYPHALLANAAPPLPWLPKT